VVTQELAKKAEKVVAVEFDRDLIPTLKGNLVGCKNVEIVNADILTLELKPYPPSPNFKVVGSIPYQITSPLIHKLLHNKTRPRSITFVIQKEVAEKICAKPPESTYLSNFVKNFGRAEIKRAVKPTSFSPLPKVDSAILHVYLKGEPDIKETEKIESFLHRAFSHPRKMVKKVFPNDILGEVKIDTSARPSTVSWEAWKKLYGKTIDLG